MKTSSNQYRNISYMKSAFANFLAAHKPYIFVSVLIIVFGLALGIFNAARMDNVNIDDMLIKAIYKFICRDKNLWGLYFSLLFLYFIPFAIIVFLNINRITSVLTYICLCIIGYFIGFDTTLIVIFRPIGGIITICICFIPCFVMILILFVILAAIFLKKNYIQKKFGCTEPNFNYLKFSAICFIMLALILLLQCLLLNIARIIIIT